MFARKQMEAEVMRRQPGRTPGEGASAAATRGIMLVTAVIVALGGKAAQELAHGVRRILRHTWRASSMVEGMNSVLRMHQARQRRLTQPLLDLKRLYWNCRTLRTGKRRKQTPYQRLRLVLPEKRWWELLKMSPEQLREELSALVSVRPTPVRERPASRTGTATRNQANQGVLPAAVKKLVLRRPEAERCFRRVGVEVPAFPGSSRASIARG
jgi:hypothetical protein